MSAGERAAMGLMPCLNVQAVSALEIEHIARPSRARIVDGCAAIWPGRDKFKQSPGIAAKNCKCSAIGVQAGFDLELTDGDRSKSATRLNGYLFDSRTFVQVAFRGLRG